MGTESSDLDGLTLLGRSAKPSKKLETFPNHNPDRKYVVALSTDEFTCVCPATGQPDFARMVIRYVPDQRILESKSLKLYLWSYRNEGVFHEHVVNTILDDIRAALDPHWIEVVGQFRVRGGIAITVSASHEKTPGSRPPSP